MDGLLKYYLNIQIPQTLLSQRENKRQTVTLLGHEPLEQSKHKTLPLFVKTLVKHSLFDCYLSLFDVSVGYRWTLGLLAFLRNSSKVCCQTEMWPPCCFRGISDPLPWQEN